MSSLAKAAFSGRALTELDVDFCPLFFPITYSRVAFGLFMPEA